MDESIDLESHMALLFLDPIIYYFAEFQAVSFVTRNKFANPVITVRRTVLLNKSLHTRHLCLVMPLQYWIDVSRVFQEWPVSVDSYILAR
ncbi:MAG: hypothetical protein ACI82Z_001300 [Cellvibrionaceae bacterium]|jgi:hypothetical protein